MAEISVLMGIYNCADTLREAVECIRQQSCQDWELILCDDGSTDETASIAQTLAKEDYRIRFLQNKKNQGLAATLNFCASVANGRFFARMDGDDRCSPDRFKKELSLMQSGKYAVVSCGMSFFDENGIFAEKLYKQFPEKSDFAHNSPFCHAGCMMDREAFFSVGGYNESPKRNRVEDFDLWFRFYQAGFRGCNLQEVLYSMREDRNAVVRKKYRYRVNEYHLKKEIAKTFGFGIKGQIMAFRPLILGLIPSFLYQFLHQKKLNHQ